MREELDEIDRRLLRALQKDASLSMDRLGALVGVSKTAAWNRVQRLRERGVIRRQVVLLDAERVGLPEIFFVAIKTNRHNEAWLRAFDEAVSRFPEIVEAYRLSGDTDYLLKVQVGSTREFDALYKAFVAAVDVYSVTSSLCMEVIKHESALPL